MSEEASSPVPSEIAKEKRASSSSSLMASEKEKKASSSPLGAAAKLKPSFPSKLMLSGSASEPVLRSALARRRSDKGTASMSIAPMSIMSRGSTGAVRRLGSGELAALAQSPSERRRRSVTTVMRQGTNGDLGTPKSAKCITPYGLIYGRPPSHFNFDRNGKMKVTPEGMEAEKEGFEPLSPKVGGFAVVKEVKVSLQVAGLAAPTSPTKVLSPKSRFQGAVRTAMRESRRPNATKVGPAKSA